VTAIDAKIANKTIAAPKAIPKIADKVRVVEPMDISVSMDLLRDLRPPPLDGREVSISAIIPFR
jgi:hypothetical protein